MSLRLEIVALDRTVLDETVDYVSLPTEAGEIGILPGHIQLISILSKGKIVAKKDGHTISIAVSKGFVYVKEDEVKAFADFAELVNEVDVKVEEKI